MNNIQINKFLTKHVKYFQGVYPIDLLPSTLTTPSVIVINLDKHYMPGSLCVAVCISESGYSYVLIRTVCHPTISKSWHSCSATQSPGHLNCHRLQGLTSNVCGHYCCIYALNRARGQSITSFVNMFVPARYTCNDKKAVRTFRARFRERPACGQLEQQQQQQ